MLMFQTIEKIPWILRIAMFATGFLGAFELISIIYPKYSPNINGIQLSSWHLKLILASINLATAWGIFTRKSWAMLLIIIAPIYQYGILYLEIPVPQVQDLKTELILSGIWLIFFTAYYFFLGKVKTMGIPLSPLSSIVGAA